MWFDVAAELAEIEGGRERAIEARPSATATFATPPASVASVAARLPKSAVSAQPETAPHVADVAKVADPETFPHGVSVVGHPLTWTGRVVSLAEWGRLSEWQRHGPDGRLWCGIARAWVRR